MKIFLPIFFTALVLAGCGKKPDIVVSSTAGFDAKENKDLKAEIASLGHLDKSVTIGGVSTSPFLITVGVSREAGSGGGTSNTGILFDTKDGKLTPLMDWQVSGGGERPALRRESDQEITVYYPTEIQGQRTWVKFKILKK